MISDRIAKRLLVAHKQKLANSSGLNWGPLYNMVLGDIEADIEADSVIVGFANRATLECEVASDPKSQQIGLQKYASLPDGHGMVFLFSPPKPATFHMASVSFPIDMIFIDGNGKVAKTVENIAPGELGTWGYNDVSMVVEANAGFCEANNVMLGSKVGMVKSALVREAASLGYMPAWYDMQTRTIHKSPGGHVTFVMESTGDNPDEFDFDRYVDGFVDSKGKFYTREQMHRIVKSPDEHFTSGELYSQALENMDNKNVDVRQLGFVPLVKQSQEQFPDYPLRSVNPPMIVSPDNVNNERFKNRDTVDVQLDNQQADSSNYDSVIGHDPSNETIETSVTRPN